VRARQYRESDSTVRARQYRGARQYREPGSRGEPGSTGAWQYSERPAVQRV